MNIFDELKASLEEAIDIKHGKENNMFKLEKTIIEAAEQALLEMKSFNDQKIDSREDFTARYYVLQAYAYLALVADSGLSEEAIKKLGEIESESVQVLQLELPRSKSFKSG